MTGTESPEISMWSERTRIGYDVQQKAVTSQHSTCSSGINACHEWFTTIRKME